MGEQNSSAQILTVGAFVALLTVVASPLSNEEDLPVLPKSLLVSASSAEEVSDVSAIAEKYGYRTLLHEVSDDSRWVLRMYVQTSGSGSAGYDLPPCPGMRPGRPLLNPRPVAHAPALHYGTQHVSERLTRWWIR